MNKFFVNIALVIAAAYSCQAQDGYIKFHADRDFSNKTNKTVKVFKDEIEIVPFFKSANANKINVIIGKDTIGDLVKTSGSFETIDSTKLTNLPFKDDLIQEKKEGLIIVNIDSIENFDSAYVYSESNSLLTRLVATRTDTFNKQDCGKTIRLIIYNAPTIYYETDKLKQFTETDLSKGQKGNENKTQSGMSWWIWVLIALVIVAISYFVWKKFFVIKKVQNSEGEEKHQIKENELLFDGDSLKEFADNNKINGGVDTLILLNKHLLPQNLNRALDSRGYNNLSESKRGKIKNRLKGKPLKISGSSEDLPLQFTETHRVVSLFPLSINNNELEELRVEKKILEDKMTELETEKEKIEEKLTQTESDKTSLANKLQQSQDEINRVQREMKGLKEKVISLDFLESYSESAFNYLKYCQQVSNDAYNFFNGVNQSNPDQTLIPGQLLMKFQTNTLSIPFGNWVQITQDIKETGATTNKSLIYGISQFSSENERKREFRRILYTEVILKYNSDILILAESFRNLDRFQIMSEAVSEVQNMFSVHVTNLLSKANSIGVETKYIPLFNSFEDYPGLGESINKKPSVAFGNFQGLQKKSIIEILQYGWKTEDGEEKTQFILA